MLQELQSMDLVSIRNLFLQEMREYLMAVEVETPELLKQRIERIKLIDDVLEKKKRSLSRDFDIA